MASALDSHPTVGATGRAERQPPTPFLPHWREARLTRWSWAMVSAYLFLWVMSQTLVFHLLQGPLGIHEGEVILMARSIAGWAVEVGITLLLVAVPVLGMTLGAAAIRRGGHWGAWASVIANAGLGFAALYMFIDDIHMTYFPSWWG